MPLRGLLSASACPAPGVPAEKGSSAEGITESARDGRLTAMEPPKGGEPAAMVPSLLPDTWAQIDHARGWLAQANTLPEIQRVMRWAAAQQNAAAQYGRLHRDTLAIVSQAEAAANEAAAIRIEAQAKAGEILREMRERGDRAEQGGDRAKSQAATLDDLGVTKSDSSRWQRVADVPEPTRRKYVEETKATGGEVTTAGLLREHEKRQPVTVDGVAPPDLPLGAFTLERWAVTSHDDRQLALTCVGTTKFNRQESREEEDAESAGTGGGDIEWALWSWNPVTGCLHNCPYCYARDIANRFYAEGFQPVLHPSRLAAPANTRVPGSTGNPVLDMGNRNVFTCSMADLFGKWVPEEWIQVVLAQTRANPQWNFLFLTKFPVRLAEFEFPDNAWVGTTVDCQARVKNAERSFRRVRAAVKWLSVEPMLEPLKFDDLGAFQWVVIGGATRSAQTAIWAPPRSWSDDLRREAERLDIPFYEKNNLLQRVRQYPGMETRKAELPQSLRYLPTLESTDAC
jgi:protein gp37